jgi:hypothetical protein
VEPGSGFHPPMLSVSASPLLTELGDLLVRLQAAAVV